MHRRQARDGGRPADRGSWRQPPVFRGAEPCGYELELTHAPARGFGDAEDFAHCGFEAFLPLLDRYQPRYLIHGHVHTEYGHAIPRMLQRGGTTIINACERYTLEL